MIKENPKPKFNKGDSVLHIPTQEVYDVVEYIQDKQTYKLQRMSGVVTAFAKESELEPYIEKPLTYDVGQRVRVINVTNLAILYKIGTIEEIPDDTYNDMYKVRFANGYAHLEASKLEPYTEENKQ